MKTQLPVADILSENYTADFHRNSEEIGFNAVANASTSNIFSMDGLTIEQQKKTLYENLKEFASLTEEERKSVGRIAEGQRGYTGLWVEKSGELWELRKHLMTAGVLPEGHPLNEYRKNDFAYMANLPVKQVPTLIPNVERFANSMEKLTLYNAEKLEDYLNIDRGVLAGPLAYGQYFVRLHIYPKPDKVLEHKVLNGVEAIGGTLVDCVDVVDIEHDGKIHKDILRASPHPDVGLITWLVGSESPGLVIWTKDKKAIPFTTDPGKIVANSADFMKYAHQKLEKYDSVIHWVGLNSESAMKDRLSIACFVHPRPQSYVGSQKACKLLYDRLCEINYFDSKTRDFLIRESEKYTSDKKMVSRILRWEDKALKEGIITEPKIIKYYSKA